MMAQNMGLSASMNTRLAAVVRWIAARKNRLAKVLETTTSQPARPLMKGIFSPLRRRSANHHALMATNMKTPRVRVMVH